MAANRGKRSRRGGKSAPRRTIKVKPVRSTGPNKSGKPKPKPKALPKPKPKKKFVHGFVTEETNKRNAEKRARAEHNRKNPRTHDDFGLPIKQGRKKAKSRAKRAKRSY